MSQAGLLGTGGGSGLVLALEGDNAVVVGPDGGGIIYIVGGPGVVVDGNAGTHTLTINTLGSEYTLTTNDGAPHTIATIAVPVNSGIFFTVNVIATENAYGDIYGGVFYQVARNAGAGAVVDALPVSQTVKDFAGDPDITFTGVAGNIEIAVVGIAATTINWKVFINTVTN